jgi:hypothetical protein
MAEQKEKRVIEADYDPAMLPCQMLAQMWYTKLKGTRDEAPTVETWQSVSARIVMVSAW